MPYMLAAALQTKQLKAPLEWLLSLIL